MPVKLTNEQYIAKCVTKMGDRWDYSKCEYQGNAKKVTIVCKDHGEFYPLANDHLSKKVGCPACAGVKKVTQEEFIERSNKAHNNRYDYSKATYKSIETKVCIICPEHGEFWQTPHSHMNGFGCDKCGGTYEVSFDEFLKRSKEVHGDTYNYDKVDYVDFKTRVTLTCKLHGDFSQSPRNHVYGKGCPICGGAAPRQKWEVVRDCQKVHGDRYDYTKTEYVSKYKKITITCKEHGDFKQLLNNHLSGSDCPLCSSTKFKPNQKGTFYIYKFSDYYGFGITNKFYGHKGRNSGHKTTFKKAGVSFDIVATYDGDGYKVQEVEDLVKRSFSIINTGLDGFKTEAVLACDGDKLVKFVEEYLAQTKTPLTGRLSTS